MQTPPKFVDFNHAVQQTSFDASPFWYNEKTQLSNTMKPDQNIPRSIIARDGLKEEIKNWFENIPTVYPKTTSSIKYLRKNKIDEFIDKMLDISNDLISQEYERNVTSEVEKFLNGLPMWYPGAKGERELLKERIKNDLLNRINGLRIKASRNIRAKHVDNKTVNTDSNEVSFDNRSLKRREQEDKEKIIESEVLDWLMQIKFKEADDIGRTINIIDATDIFTKRLLPLLDKPSGTKNYKLILKGLIIDTLNDLPNVIRLPKNKRVYLNRMAENLATRLINLQVNHRSYFNILPGERSTYQLTVCSKSSLKQTILDGLSDCFLNVSVDHSNEMKEEITDILIDCLESIQFEDDMECKEELINNVLGNYPVQMSETQTSDFTIENVRDILASDIMKNADNVNKIAVNSCQSGCTISVFTSENEISSKYPAASTPKPNSIKQETSRLNKAEIDYMDKVSRLIRNWMETLPTKYEGEENENYKNIMINDLAGDIMDQHKIEQLAPQASPDKDKLMFYIVFRWLFRFDVYEDLNDATPQINDLTKRLYEIPVPDLTMPQSGNRQAMANIKHMEGSNGWEEDFVPKDIDILEDEISIWMNEQPPEIYSKIEKEYQNKMVQELAETIKNKIGDKSQEEKLDNDVAIWLRLMLKSSERKNIDSLKESLKSRITNLPKGSLIYKEKNASDTSYYVRAEDEKHINNTESGISQNTKLTKNTEIQNDTEVKPHQQNIIINSNRPVKTKDTGSDLSQTSVSKNVKERDSKVKPVKKSVSNICMCPFKESLMAQSSNSLGINKKKQKFGSKDKTKPNNLFKGNRASIPNVCECSAKLDNTKLSNQKQASSSTTDSKSIKASSSENVPNTYGYSTSTKYPTPKNFDNSKTDKKPAKPRLNSVFCECSGKVNDNAQNKTPGKFSDTPAKNSQVNATSENPQLNTSNNAPVINSRNNNYSFYKEVSNPYKDSACKNNSCVGNAKPIPMNLGTPEENDRTLIEMIGKYMERNDDVQDSTAKGAFGEILKNEFRKLTPPTRKEVYDNFSKPRDRFTPERLDKELQHIKDISDWLKNIPIDGSFNTPQNKERIEFVNDLATSIYEIEEGRRNEPAAMNYDEYLSSVITQYTENLPILPDQIDNVPLMVDQLVNKIEASRTPTPCCDNVNKTSSSLNSTGIPEQSIGEFVNNYIRLNAGEIADDRVKLDAWSARVLKEVKKIVRDSADPSTLCKAQVYDKLANISIPEEESIRLFGLELDYAKEISDWLNNFPLLPITTPEASEKRVKMISDLAEKFVEREKKKLVNPTETQSDTEILEYVTKWIQQIPLERNKQVVMPTVIKQLMNRIERVNKGPQEVLQETIIQSANTPKKSKPKSRGSKCNSCSSAEKGGELIVNAIEDWSNSLPIKAENKDAEKNMKDAIARKLYQKVGNFTVDPHIMNDDLLFQEMLTHEVNNQLDSVPKNPNIEKKRESLKNSLVDKVMEAKSLARESAAGENYKQHLETTIDASIPNPVSNRQSHDPGFEMYKNRLTEMFILDNFDHGTDDVKIKYEKRIKKEIDKYFQDAQKRNAIPLSKEQIYSELYGALFRVPVPSKSSTTEEVEEVKTRCEVADWFDDLPLQPMASKEELLNRDKIQSMLAKRLKEIENKEKKPDDKMHKEITKWLLKLPLLPGNEGNVDKLADDLQNKLKLTKDERKCVPPPSPNNKDNKHFRKISTTKGILGTSQVAGPSSAGQMWKSPPSSPDQICCQVPHTLPRKRASDIILEIVENWCNTLPLFENDPRSKDINKTIREDVATKIIIKICELNSDPQIFSDNLLYNCLLDDELEKIMADLPICCPSQQDKDFKKAELKEAVNAVKHLIIEERERHEYKKELNETVNNVLKEPLDTSEEIIALFNELREEIVDNFVQYHYNRDDDEGKQIYKARLHDAVLKYFLEIQQKSDRVEEDPLIKQNQLLCELAKIPIPTDRSMKDEVEEIKMKNEVKEFFNELHLPKEEDLEKMKTRNNLKLSLAKRLNELEKTGHNCDNDAKMKKEISRYLKKMDQDVDPKEIQSFVDKLRATEPVRKAPPVGNNDPGNVLQDFNQVQNRELGHDSYQNQNHEQKQSGYAVNASRLQDPQNLQNLQARSNLCCPADRSLGVTPVEYQGFGGGVALSSSPQPENGQSQPENGQSQPGNGKSQPNKANIGPTNQISNHPPEHLAGRFEQRKRQKTPDGEGSEECKCLVRKRRKIKRPRCVLRQFCDDCDDYGPMWMPMQPLRYPPYFYY